MGRPPRALCGERQLGERTCLTLLRAAAPEFQGPTRTASTRRRSLNEELMSRHYFAIKSSPINYAFRGAKKITENDNFLIFHAVTIKK
jgi:hypothetical protein